VSEKSAAERQAPQKSSTLHTPSISAVLSFMLSPSSLVGGIVLEFGRIVAAVVEIVCMVS
jgi:hypothetical protein